MFVKGPCSSDYVVLLMSNRAGTHPRPVSPTSIHHLRCGRFTGPIPAVQA